jgi:phenylpropionate dioxygenase-like ring-hydroxylating dioxygenase large terminal subunit
MEMKDGFDTQQHRLRPLQVDTWEGFIYVTLAENPAKQLSEVLEPLRSEVVGRYDMSCYRTVLRESMEWGANWKNLIENFTESYHVPIAHGKTFAQHNKPPQDYVCGEDSAHYCYHRAPQAAETGLGAAHPLNDRLEGEWRRMMIDFCVFPNHLVTLMPDYLWYISVQPQGTDKMHATWGLAVPPEVLADVSEEDFDDWLARFKDYMEVANGEDKALVEALHLGSASPFLPAGTYHPIERNLWQFTNYLAGMCKP